MKKDGQVECAGCNVAVRICRSREGSGPGFCPTKTREKEIQSAKEKYRQGEILRFARAASLQEHEKVRVGQYETMCNPIAQAEILNQAGTDFNILVGLCVGHDALFLKHAEALTTVLVAKDRVPGHNSVAALYGAQGYFQRLMNPGR